VIKLLQLGRVAWNLGVPRLLIVVRRGRGWKKLSRVWFASSCVSQINFTVVAAVNI
jgi:hypothetical protein